MSNLTDIIESMAHKMEEMNKRIEALEHKHHKKDEDDEQGMFQVP